MELPDDSLYCDLMLIFLKDPQIQGLLSENMFAVPNKNAFEHVMFGLLHVIDKGKCENLPEPNRFTEAKFRAEVFRIIKELSAEHLAAGIPRITPSLFLSPGGDRFIELVCKLADLALEIKVQNMAKDRPGITLMSTTYDLAEDETDEANEVLESLTEYNKQRYMEIEMEREREVKHFKDGWTKAKKCEAFLNKEIAEHLRTLKADVELLMCDPDKKNSLLNLEDQDVVKEWNKKLEEEDRKNAEKMQKLKIYREQFRDFYKSVHSLNSAHVSPVIIDGFKILPKTAETEPLYGDDQMVLARFVEQANQSVKQIVAELRKANIVDMNDALPMMKTLLEKLTELAQGAPHHLQLLCQLSSQIAAAKEEKMNENVEEIETEDKHNIKVVSQTPAVMGYDNGVGALDLPFKTTPPFCFAINDGTQSPQDLHELSMSPVRAQSNSFDFSTTLTAKVDLESVAGLLAPSTIKKRPRRPLFSGITPSSKQLSKNALPAGRKLSEIKRNLLSHLAMKHSQAIDETPIKRNNTSQEKSSIYSPLMEMHLSTSCSSSSPQSSIEKAPSPATLDKVVEHMVATVPNSVKREGLVECDPGSPFSDQNECSDGDISFLAQEFGKMVVSKPGKSPSVDEHFKLLGTLELGTYKCISTESPPVFCKMVSSDSEDDDIQ